MNFEKTNCERIGAQLDSHMSGELPVETDREVLRHLEDCGVCSAEFAARRHVKGALQRAVKKDVAPASLHYRIRQDIRRPQPVFTWQWQRRWQHWALAAAATLVLAVGGWGVFQTVFRAEVPAGTQASGEKTAEPALALTAQDVAVLNVGLGNHVHCAVEKDLAHRRFTEQQMSDKLGTEFAGLVPLVRGKISGGFEVMVGHRCRFQKREFVHLILKRGEEVVSLTVTKKQGEAFSEAVSVNALQASGVSLRGGRVRDYEVAGFETRDYLAFVSSNLPERDNTLIVTSLAPGVRDFLSELET